MSLARAALYLDAVRRMRPRQVAWRARRLLPPRILAAGIDEAPVSWRPLPCGIGVNPAPQSQGAAPPHESGVFAAVGVSRAFPSPGFWDSPADGLLFLFHLHGFEDLAAYAATGGTEEGDAFWATVVESWLAEEDVPSLPAWHPYPTSLRLISWCAALSGLSRWPRELRDRIARTVRRQALYLRRSVEHDIGGNHVLKNGVALTVSGTLLGESRLRSAGLRLLRREVARQFLADGGHEERSTSYHRLVVDDLLDVQQAVGVSSESWLDSAIDRGIDWMEALAGPDGRLPLLNDAWEGPPVRRGAADVLVTSLPESGYTVFRHGGDQAVFDAGPLCPPHLPPHGHADALSFVLWGDGRPVVVDPGAGAYTGPMRNRFRATAAHNTVELEGESQCELWGDFRLARLPTVRAGAPVHHGDDVVTISASHDGYRRLASPATHARVFVWCDGDGVVVVDRIDSSASLRARAPLHLASGIEPTDDMRAGPFLVRPLGEGTVTADDDLYSPELGAFHPAKTLQLVTVAEPGRPFGWSLLRPPAEVTEVGRASLTLRRRDGSVCTVPLRWT